MLGEASDRYENLVSKVTAAMRWASRHERARWVVKVDDDVFIDLPNLWRPVVLSLI